MPSYTDTSSGYVQWQSARRQAKQLSQDATIDIIEHYNRAMLNGDRDGHGHTRRYNGHIAGAVDSDHVGYTVTDEESPRAPKKLTPRGQNKKTTTLRAEHVDRKSGAFTEGISSLSRQTQFPLSLQRTDIISDNQPDTVKMAREKSTIYLALSHPGPKQISTKGDQSAKSARTLPPPWGETLSVTEIVRAKTFTMDERAGLSTLSTLDSLQTASDVHPATDRKIAIKPGGQFSMFYPSVTAPPNSPLQMPRPYKPKVPSVNIVSLDGQTVNDSVKKTESRLRLPVPFRNVTSTATGSVATGEFKASNKPGIDLPQLPLRYTETKETSFQFTPRERPARANFFMHTKGRRRIGIGQMKKNAKLKSATTDNLEQDETTGSKTSVTDPYANRFQHVSSVTSVGEVHIPHIHPCSSEDHHGDSEREKMEVMLPEPTVMLTVQEEDESAEKGSPSTVPSIPQHEDPPQQQPDHLSDLEITPQAVLAHRVKTRTLSVVNNTSLLSVPFISKDLSEARPPTAPMAASEVHDVVTLEIPVLTKEAEETGHSNGAHPEDAAEEEKQATSPEIASTSVVDTARTIATQTSLPYDPDAPDNRPTVVKIKTLSMFPDINGAMEGLSMTSERQMAKGMASEPLLRMSHGDSYGPEVRLLELPELKGAHGNDKHSMEEEDLTGLKRKSSGVQNMTFISPLEGQQKARRF